MNSYPDQGPSTQPDDPGGYPSATQWMPLSRQEMTLESLLRTARKYFWLVLICILLGLAYAQYINAHSTPMYSAVANIQLTQDSASRLRIDPVGGDAGYIDASQLDTELQILRSATLAVETIQSLRLDKNKDFAAPPPGRAWDMSNTRDRHALVGVFQGGLSTSRSGHTEILQIGYSSPNPQLAAQICNKLIENYVEHNFKDNYEATAQVSKWLQAQLGELRLRLQASQERMVAMQNEIGIVGVDQTQSIALVRLEALNSDLTKTEVERMVQEARLIALKSSTPAVLDTLSNDAVIAQLRQQKSKLNEEYSAMNSRYGDANPRMMALHSEMAQIDQGIRDAETTIVRRAEKELEASLRNEATLRAQLDQEKQRAYAANSKGVEYALARREYESNRTLYDQLEQRLQEAGIIAGLHSSSIRMIDPADTPDFPSKPRKTFNLGAGFLAGLGIGLLLSLLIHFLDTNIKSVSDVEEKLGLPLLGVIPAADNKTILPEPFIAQATSGVEAGWSQLVESYRSLRTSVLLSQAGRPPKVLLITSSKPAEGKTAVSSLSAITLALSGARVLLIDGDLRRPSVHARFKIPNRIGLSSILSGKSTFAEAKYQHPIVPSLDILTSGPIAPMPAELLGATQMADLITDLRAQYDFIVIDTPPVLTVTDAIVLISVTDGVVMVLRYGEATTKATLRSRDLLLRSGANLLGAVLNAVDYKSPDYAEYYGRSYTDYYTYRGDV